jgi:hypothetical protein
MKIDEIQELINYLGGMAIIKGCKYPQEEIRKAIATLERLKPVTITADPATWPPVDVQVLTRNIDGMVIGYFGKFGMEHYWRYDNGVHLARVRFGVDKWQHLPGWEE